MPFTANLAISPEPVSQYRDLREVGPRRTAQKERFGGYGGGAGLRKNKPVPVRLVAFPVTKEPANLRRMKAKKNQRETSIQRGALLDGLVDFYHHPLKRSDAPPNRSRRYTPYAGG